MTHSKVSIGGGNFPASHGDSRDGLGYGRLRPTYGMKSMGNNYPYTAEEDSDFDWEDADVDEEDIAAVSDRQQGPRDYDHAGGHYDPFSFAGGNTKLGEATSISPIPHSRLYGKNFSRSAVGGTKTGKVIPAVKHGTVPDTYGSNDGFSTILSYDGNHYDENENEEDIYNLEDVANVQQENILRKYIRNLIEV